MKLNIYEEASRCLLCEDAPCTKACATGDPARAIRAIRFDNHKPALRWVKDCSDDDLLLGLQRYMGSVRNKVLFDYHTKGGCVKIGTSSFSVGITALLRAKSI